MNDKSEPGTGHPWRSLSLSLSSSLSLSLALSRSLSLCVYLCLSLSTIHYCSYGCLFIAGGCLLLFVATRGLPWGVFFAGCKRKSEVARVHPRLLTLPGTPATGLHVHLGVCVDRVPRTPHCTAVSSVHSCAGGAWYGASPRVRYRRYPE